MMTSSAAPSQKPCTAGTPIPTYLSASMISASHRAAMPASSVVPRYGSHSFSAGAAGIMAAALSRTQRMSSSFSTLWPVME